MKFDKELIVKYASVGIMAEINECYRSIRTGEKILYERKNGRNDLAKSKTDDEVREIIRKKYEKIEEIYRLKEDLIYALEIDEMELEDLKEL